MADVMALALRPCLAIAFFVAGCIPAPAFDSSNGGVADPFETDGPNVQSSGGARDDGTTDGTDETTASEPEPGGPAGSDGDTGDGVVSTSGVETISGGQGDTGDDETSSSTGGPVSPFPPPEPFGDDADEVALVGTWGVESTDGGAWRLSIADDGWFVWDESNDVCDPVGDASGWLWSDGTQLVFHVETWNKREPWPVSTVVGAPLEPPFRLSASYGAALGMLSLSGPAALTDPFDWSGRIYRREPGVGLLGSWHSTASLQAVLPGEDSPRVIVEDTYSMETAAGAQAFETLNRRWTHGPTPVDDPPVERQHVWYNLTPGQAEGMISLGGTPHLYDGERLVAFAESQVLDQSTAGCGM